MKVRIFLLLILSSILMSASHKFYVSIYRIDFSSEKKRLEITSRIFVDDLNLAIERKYGRKVMFGEPSESAADVELMKKYLASHFVVKINGKDRPMEFLSHEYESNVIICYFRITGIDRVKSLEIRNTALTDYVTDQQNIIQTAVNGKKKSVILTADNPVQQYQY